ncbi:MAG: hypothetical protein RHS_5293 [Robinsoniella sp. RHS]|nr:MAG: hypothetical protein RHS_5293 [Robinsoniella sp. RHS]
MSVFTDLQIKIVIGKLYFTAWLFCISQNLPLLDSNGMVFGCSVSLRRHSQFQLIRLNRLVKGDYVIRIQFIFNDNGCFCPISSCGIPVFHYRLLRRKDSSIICKIVYFGAVNHSFFLPGVLHICHLSFICPAVPDQPVSRTCRCCRFCFIIQSIYAAQILGTVNACRCLCSWRNIKWHHLTICFPFNNADSIFISFLFFYGHSQTFCLHCIKCCNIEPIRPAAKTLCVSNFYKVTIRIHVFIFTGFRNFNTTGIRFVPVIPEINSAAV